MNNKTILIVLALFVGLVMFSSCKKDDIASYQEGYSAINFTADSTGYSFLGNDSTEHVQEIPVQVIGDSVDHDRQFEVTILHDSLTTAQETDYEIMGGLVKAGEFTGTLSVKLFKTDRLSDKQISLHLKIQDTATFKVGNTESNDVAVYWTNKVIVPSWTYYSYFFCSAPSTQAYRIVVQTTGLLKFDLQDYLAVGPTGATALGRKFGNYIKQYNLDHPNNHLKHDDGPKAGEEIEPIYYSQSLYN